MDCSRKVRFSGRKEAEDYIRYVLLDEKGMEAYECAQHNCWHMGHPKDYSNNPVVRVNQILDDLYWKR